MSSPLLDRLPGWSGEGLVLLLLLALSTAYVVGLPSFEGPDESEHARYVQAWAEGGDVHPIDPEQPLRWGYQVHHPPLYYALAGTLARGLGVTFHESLVINAAQNRRFPFLRHDTSGQVFPYDDVHRGLHLLRLFSVVLGVLTFFVLRHGFRLLFPDEPAARVFLLGAALLAPNTLQLFGIVANDALNLLLSSSLLVLAIRILREARPGIGAFALTGACAGLAVLSKLTGLAALAVAGSAWAVDALVNRRLGVYLRGMVGFLPVFLLLTAPWLAANVEWYGDPTRESLLRQLTPAFHLGAPRPLAKVFEIIADHLPFQLAVDLGWQSIRLRELGSALFTPWLLGVLGSGALAFRRAGQERRLAAERLIPLIALVWSLVLLVVANREWTNLQIRHVWCLYPFTLAGVVYVLGLLPENWQRRGPVAAGAALAGLLLLNAHVLTIFREFYEPHSSSRMNRDYYTYLYTQVRDRDRAQQYLRNGR